MEVEGLHRLAAPWLNLHMDHLMATSPDNPDLRDQLDLQLSLHKCLQFRNSNLWDLQHFRDLREVNLRDQARL